MGDLRNKLAKQARDEAHRRWLAKHYPESPLPEPLRCGCCLRTMYEVTALYDIPGDPRLPVFLCCDRCLPPGLR